jgi:hypothetical protein
MQLIGNAVPPLLAGAIGTSLAASLQRATLERNGGALLSFVPTMSAGRSPALDSITRRISIAFPEVVEFSPQARLWL